MSTTMTFGPGTTPGQGGTIPAEVRQAYDTRLLLAARPALVHAAFCDDKPIPKHQGTTMHMRRFELLTVATAPVPLVEGVTPTSETLTVTDVPVSIAQYGSYVQVSDYFSMVAIDDILLEAADLLGFKGGQTIDAIARNFMNIGTNVTYANSRTSRASLATGDYLTARELKLANLTLRKAYVAPYDGKNYVGILTSDQAEDVKNINEWLLTGEYSDPDKIYQGELGMLYGIRFVETPIGTIYPGAGASGQDIHAALVFGAHAFTKSELSGANMQMITKPVGSAGTADPLDQRATSGWKATFGGTISNQNFVNRIETSISL